MNDLEIWFQDEARIGQRGTITRMWAKKGTRPRAIKQVQYEYAYIFGAVCPERDKAVAVVVPDVGTDSMLVHLHDIAKNVAPGKTAILLLDRAAWHTTRKLDIFPNVRLLCLPPASPELNPVEQVWQQLRDNSLANRCYKDYADIENACCDAWMDYVSRPGAITSLCTRQWAKINSDNLNG